jgi:acyl-CoA thioesterase FadM
MPAAPSDAVLVPTSLADLESRGLATAIDAELRLRIRAEWVVVGEDRLGYATIARLVECVREVHWRRDVIPAAAGASVDTITKRLELDFHAPLLVGSEIVGAYRVTSVRERSYRLAVSMTASSTGALLAEGLLVNVFYDPKTRSAIACPPALRDALTRSI